MEGIPVQQQTVALNYCLLGCIRRRLCFAHGGLHAVMTPCNLKSLRIRLALYPGSPDETGESTRGVSTSRKTEDVDFVANLIIGHDEPVTILDNFL